MMNWIATNVFDLAKNSIKRSPKDNDIHLLLSPYDVPEGVRVCAKNHILMIEFKYIHIIESRIEENEYAPGISFSIGEKTERIYQIRVDTHVLGDNELNILIHPEPIESAIDNLITQQESNDKKADKYRANKSIFKDYAESLQQSLSQQIAPPLGG